MHATTVNLAIAPAAGEALQKILAERSELTPDEIRRARRIWDRLERKGPFGPLLVDLGLLTRGQLDAAQAALREALSPAEILVESGHLDPEILARAAAEAGSRGIPLETHLLGSGATTEELLLEAKGFKHGVGVVRLEPELVDMSLYRALPPSAWRRLQALPLISSAETCELAMTRIDRKTIEEFRAATRKAGVPRLCSASAMSRTLHAVETPGAVDPAPASAPARPPRGGAPEEDDPGAVPIAEDVIGKEHGGDRSVLDRVLRHVREGGPGIPAVPDVAGQVRRVAANEHAGAREIAKVVGHDQVLAASLLRYANSAMYRGLRAVADLQTAVARLGVKMVIAAMMAELSRSLYRFEDPDDGEIFKTLWKHSVACAESSRRVARLVQYAEPEQAFLTGLVHDIGKVAALTSLAHLRSRGDLAWPRDVALQFIAETHALVGSELLKRWKLPPEICELVHDHHREIAPGAAGIPLAILQFADLACAKLGYAQDAAPGASLLAAPSAGVLRLTDLGIACLLVDLEETLPIVMHEI